VARTLAANLRSSDFVARWGGDEFVAVIVNVGVDELRTCAEKLRVLVAGSSISLRGVRLTISIGGTVAQRGDTFRSLFRRADELTYQSKAGGGNRVTVARSLGES
jgi:diguanylate cyclase (GGDEF)-like protein